MDGAELPLHKIARSRKKQPWKMHFERNDSCKGCVWKLSDKIDVVLGQPSIFNQNSISWKQKYLSKNYVESQSSRRFSSSFTRGAYYKTIYLSGSLLNVHDLEFCMNKVWLQLCTSYTINLVWQNACQLLSFVLVVLQNTSIRISVDFVHHPWQ